MSYTFRHTGSARFEFPDKKVYGCEAVWEGDVRYTVQNLGVGRLGVLLQRLLQRFLESLQNQTIKHSDTRQDFWAQCNAHPEEHAAQGTPGRVLVI